MDQRTLTVLEFDRVLAAAAGLASTDLGRAAVLSLRPLAQPERQDYELDRLAEMVGYLAVEAGFDFTGLIDLRPLLAPLDSGGSYLDPEDLALVGEVLACLSRLKGRLKGLGKDYPLLAALAEGLGDHRDLTAAFKRTFGPGLTIADSASPELKRIRRRLTGIKDTIRSELQTILDDGRSQQLWQDELITQRSGRFVLPVRSGRQGRLDGIIHDSSASRQTVYLEPLAVTGLNNQLGLMSAEERREVIKILTRLTDQLRPLADQLIAEVALAGELDGVQARARLARGLRAVRPELIDHGRLKLRQARHPLLVLGPTEAVPVDLHFPEGKSVLIVSGPNAGGKTVALKTMGLLTLMALSGLFIPADEGAEVPRFRAVAASIGDEQAISDGRSTYSARLAWLREMVDSAGPGRLVLIDELGGGTDPAEGAALGLAVLDSLADQGAHILATTHLNAVKSWAAARPEADNLSVLFEPDTKRPTFELAYGRPGLSNAFDIAAQVGLKPELIDRAAGYLGGDEERFKTILARLAELADSHDQARKLAQAEETRLRRIRREAEADRDDLKRRRDKLAAEGKKQIEAKIARAEATLERILARAEAPDKKARDRAKYRFYDEKSRLKTTFAPSAEKEAAPNQAPSLSRGQAVKVKGFPQPGEVTGLARSGGRVEVRLAGGLRVKVDPADLSPAAKADQPARQPAPQPVTGPARSGLWPEVKIIGLRVDEALPVVDKALDEAALDGTGRLAIVHGIGTGALRSAVREFLAGHPQVKRFGSASGTSGPAVTEVELN